MEPSTQTRLLTMTEQIPAQRAPTSTPDAASLKDAVKPMTYIRTSREAGGIRIKRFAIAASFAFESKTWSAETSFRSNSTATVAITITAAAVANNNNNHHIVDHDHDDALVLTAARGRKASFWYRLPPRFWRGGGGYLAPHLSRSSAECCSKQYRDESQSIAGGYYCPKRFEALGR